MLLVSDGENGSKNEKQKYTVVKRPTVFVHSFQVHVDQRQEIQIGKYIFERVNTFKYLGVELYSLSVFHEGIKLRANAGNKYFFALNKIFKLSLLFKKNQKNNYIKYQLD